VYVQPPKKNTTVVVVRSFQVETSQDTALGDATGPVINLTTYASSYSLHSLLPLPSV
jgi:hypothetical protein